MAEPTLPQVVELIEASDKPVVAALNGVALGGGCEIALACHYRIASRAARIGLPEVKLGIVPGAGGTQRLPRLTGTLAAAEMIATGRIIGAEEALSLGIVDKVTDGDLARQAIAAARRLVVTPPRRTGELAVAVGKGADVDALADKILAKARGQIAPAEAIRLVRLAAEASLADGLAEERATFLMLRDSEQSKALRHVFFAERAAAKVPGIEHVEPRPVATIGVIGAGLMGSGIAVSALNAGYRVICIEQTAERATAGAKRIAALLDRAVASGRLDADGRADRLSRLEVTANMNEAGDRRPGDRGGVRRPDGQDGPLPRARQASCGRMPSWRPTPAISIPMPSRQRPRILNASSDCTSSRRPTSCGWSRWCAATRPRSTCWRQASPWRKSSASCRSSPASAKASSATASSRPTGARPSSCVEDGALPQEIDAAMEDFGMAMGPFAVFDLAGLEIAWARRKRQAATRDPTERYVEIADRLCEAGRFGQKSGKGWYAYPDGKRTVDPEVTH